MLVPLALFVLSLATAVVGDDVKPLKSPVIGILAESDPNKADGPGLIVASYVKFIESAGAQVLPIKLNQDKAYYEAIFNKTNGLLLPGEDKDKDIASTNYYKAAQILLEQTEKNNLYPVFGIGLGFLTIVINNNATSNINLTTCKLQNQVLTNQDVVTDNTNIFTNGTVEVKQYLKQGKAAISYQNQCITKEEFTDTGDLSTAMTYQSYITGVTTSDGRIFGIQWHPEMSPFEWVTVTNRSQIPHSREDYAVSQHLANFFVQKAREYKRDILPDDYNKEAIYNFQPDFTGKDKSAYSTQVYYLQQSAGNSLTSSVVILLLSIVLKSVFI